ncbi:hypothetical protein L915_00294 [Phytophthora nicotianae]|uniref:Uncharacterized protein n=1 Tax=Phytophthora nicotianae TaxID=4792 RepID=W2HPC9_PHYNI|nr:hypothetical protein L915_00294 [Phytophthora nicotianae]ETL50475.1 hypothetical protein L916_00293 [Phytophthora nicotianae]
MAKHRKPEPSSSLAHGISKDPNLFAFGLNVLCEQCKNLYSAGPSMVQCPQFYTAVVFALHPENILSAAYKFGSSRPIYMASSPKRQR